MVRHRRKRLSAPLRHAALVCSAWLLAVACGGAERDDDGRFDDDADDELTLAEQVCEGVADTVGLCGPPSSCELAVAADCAPVVSALSDDFLIGLRDCVDQGGTATGCIAPALAGTPPRPTHEAFVPAFCGNCAFGIAGCEGLFGPQAPEQLAPVRSLLLALGEDVVGQVTAECTSGPTCGADFASCVAGVLVRRAIPDQAVGCAMEMLMNPTADACGSQQSAQASSGAGPSSGSGVSTSSSSTSSGSGGSGGTGGTGGGGGSGGTGGGSVCSDTDSEPNDSEASYVPVGTLYDCDAAATVGGTVDGPGDDDWYRFTGYDDFCWVNPAVALTSGPSGARLCMYFECLAGQTTVSCPAGASAETSPSGRPGCCGPASGFTVSSVDCSGTINDDARAYVRVDEPQATTGACHEYTLSYSY